MTNINSPKLLALYLEWLADELSVGKISLEKAETQIKTLHQTGDLVKLKSELINIASTDSGFLIKIHQEENLEKNENDEDLGEKLQTLFIQKPELANQIIEEYLTKSSTLSEILSKYPELSN